MTAAPGSSAGLVGTDAERQAYETAGLPVGFYFLTTDTAKNWRWSGSAWIDTTGGGSSAFPVGAVYTSVTGVNPATELGYGTWSAFGAGRVLVGRDGADVDFDVAEETGGAKTHTHAGHANHVVTQAADHPATATGAASAGAQKIGTTNSTVTLATHTHLTPVLAHSGTAVDAHSAHDSPKHLMPYAVVYFWKRTA